MYPIILKRLLGTDGIGLADIIISGNARDNMGNSKLWKPISKFGKDHASQPLQNICIVAGIYIWTTDMTRQLFYFHRNLDLTGR